MKIATALLLIVLFAASAVAQAPAPSSANPPPDEIVATPNRPTVTNTADTTQRGVLELEFGIYSARRQQALQGLLKFGLFRDLELQWSGNPWQHDADAHEAGVSDNLAGFRWRFHHQGRLTPTLSFQYNVSLPSATGSLGNGDVGHNFTLLASKDLPAKFHVDTNLNYQLFHRPGGYDHFWLPDFTLSRQLTDKWSVSMEFSGNTRANAATPAVIQNLWAVGYAVKPRLVLDSAVQFRMMGPVPAAAYLGGFTFSIADLYHHRW
jgi:hypothetical protein